MPSEAQIQTTGQDLFRIIEELRKYAGANTTRFTGTPEATGETVHEKKFIDNLQSDYAYHAAMVNEVERFRGGLGRQIEFGRILLTPYLREYGRFIEAPETDPAGILRRLYDHFVANSLAVQSRGYSFGAPAAVSGTGTGVINRLTVDADDHDIELPFPDNKVAICIRDEHSGTPKHEELFEFRGAERNRDLITLGGSGELRAISALSARHSLGYILNPSFDDTPAGGSVASPNDIPNWLVAGISLPDSQIALDEGTTYRDYDGVSTPRSLKFTAVSGGSDLELQQAFSVRRFQVTPDIPLYVQFAINKGTATQGTVQVTVGTANSESAFDIATLAAGWNIIRLKTSNPHQVGADKNSWYKNFKPTSSSAPDITIEVGGLGVGEHVFIDDVVISPFSYFDGSWYAVVGGQTKFIRDKKFTWSDSIASDSVIQKWLALLFQAYLPHDPNVSLITWADP